MSEEATDTTPDTDGGDEVQAPEGNGWWRFEAKDDAVAWFNDKVQKRLAREKSKYDPIVVERDTLKARVAELEPFEQANQSDAQRWESERAFLQAQLEELQSFRSVAERNDLVREIAEEKGLPGRFISRVQGDDAESITADIEELLNVLKDGKPTKPASRKPAAAEERPVTKGYGGGGSRVDEDDKSVIAELRKKARTHQFQTYTR